MNELCLYPTELRLNDCAGHYIAIKLPIMTHDITFTLPANLPTKRSVLIADTAGVLSWYDADELSTVQIEQAIDTAANLAQTGVFGSTEPPILDKKSMMLTVANPTAEQFADDIMRKYKLGEYAP